ncbi:Uncharacterized protein pbN1_34460 [Aromatoleum bremense]|nr:Uncharacterized protein pbN1_34460 [Aromatoleum bremense]
MRWRSSSSCWCSACCSASSCSERGAAPAVDFCIAPGHAAIDVVENARDACNRAGARKDVKRADSYLPVPSSLYRREMIVIPSLAQGVFLLVAPGNRSLRETPDQFRKYVADTPKSCEITWKYWFSCLVTKN